MKRLLGLAPEHYWIDAVGVRTTCFGRVHYPDYCVHYDNTQYGNCDKHCARLPWWETPCGKAMREDTANTSQHATRVAAII